MKDLFKTRQQKTVTSKDADKHPVSSSRDVANFLQKVASMPGAQGDARLIFALDATASRQPTWDMATQLQAEMFSSAQSLGGLSLQLCYFRGIAEFFRSGWQTSGEELLQLMTTIQCQAGATQIGRVLRQAIKENETRTVKALVFIGDAMEENRDTLAQLAGKLGLLNVPVFMFQEGGDPLAREAFLDISRLSGGAYSHFDARSASQLRDLLQAVAVYAAGGLQALKDFSRQSSESVKLLQQQLSN